MKTDQEITTLRGLGTAICEPTIQTFSPQKLFVFSLNSLTSPGLTNIS